MRERLGLSRIGAPLVVGFFSLPLLALVVRAFADVWRAPALVPQRFGTRGFDVAFATGDAGGAFANSMIVALVTVTIGLALAWPAARVLGERRLRHPALVFTLLAMPFLVPPFAIGTGLTTWFIRLGLIDTLPGIVLAHLTAVLPYVVAILLSGFGPKVRELEEMARSLGASPRQRLAWVTVPAVRPTLAAATLLGFLVSWVSTARRWPWAAESPCCP